MEERDDRFLGRDCAESIHRSGQRTIIGHGDRTRRFELDNTGFICSDTMPKKYADEAAIVGPGPVVWIAVVWITVGSGPVGFTAVFNRILFSHCIQKR